MIRPALLVRSSLSLSLAYCVLLLPGTGRAQEAESAVRERARAFLEHYDQMVAQAEEESESRVSSTGLLEYDPDVESFVSLQEALRLALRNNLSLHLARLGPLGSEQDLRTARSAFHPRVSGAWSFGQGESPNDNRLEDRNSVVSDTWNYNGGISGQLPFLGLEYSSRYSMNRGESNSSQRALQRSFRGRWDSTLSLPLMRGFRIDNNRLRLRSSELDLEISESGFEDELAGIVAAVERLYWELAGARAQLNVSRRSLGTARDLLEQTRTRYEVGIASRIEVTQAEAGVAEREVAAIRAENTAAGARDDLLNVLLAPDARTYEQEDIVPEVPEFRPFEVDLESAIENALLRRPDVAQARKRIENEALSKRLADDQTLPELNLEAGYEVEGLAGKYRDPAIESSESWDSFQDFFRAAGAHSWSARANFNYVLGNEAAQAAAVRSSIALRRARTQMRQLEQTVILEVREAVRNVESAGKQVVAADRRRVAVAENLAAEQERLRLGDSTPFRVLEVEEDLAGAESQLIDALTSHRMAITTVQRRQGVLLEARGINVRDQLEVEIDLEQQP